MRHVFQDFCNRRGISFSVLTENQGRVELVVAKQGKEGLEVIFDPKSSNVNSFKSHPGLRGIHVIRHPLNLVISGMAYHRNTDEEWANIPRETLGNLSIRQHLCRLSDHDALLYEINSARDGILDMYGWDYTDPRFLNVHFEDFRPDYDGVMLRIAGFLGYDGDEFVETAIPHDLTRKSSEEIRSMEHVTNKGRSGRDYREILTGEHYARFSSLYPDDLFEVLGYPPVPELESAVNS